MAATCSKCNIGKEGLCIHEKGILLSIILTSAISWIAWIIW
ncbi:MAG: hypothetical protein ABEK04_04320 [Candidatus Nanohalobium sp.]